MGKTWGIIIGILMIIVGCGSIDTIVSDTPATESIEVDGCKIENPDPDGYLLKICEYLKQHKDDIDVAPADPAKYKIKSIVENGEYSKYEGEKEIITKAKVVNLDCCYMGDAAYFDKKTKELIGFRVGDM